jgi:hypothetical protein
MTTMKLALIAASEAAPAKPQARVLPTRGFSVLVGNGETACPSNVIPISRRGVVAEVVAAGSETGTKAMIAAAATIDTDKLRRNFAALRALRGGDHHRDLMLLAESVHLGVSKLLRRAVDQDDE